jgi:hypothetical protein
MVGLRSAVATTAALTSPAMSFMGRTAFALEVLGELRVTISDQ